MTDIKPCTVKGCRETQYHHHYLTPGAPGVYECEDPNSCATLHWEGFSTVVAPRLTRKALNARIAELEAENADLFAEIADKKDRLARCEGVAGEVVDVSPFEWLVTSGTRKLGEIRPEITGGRFAAYSMVTKFWTGYNFKTAADASRYIIATAREAGAL